MRGLHPPSQNPQAGAAPKTLRFYSAISANLLDLNPYVGRLYFLVKILPPFRGSNLDATMG